MLGYSPKDTTSYDCKSGCRRGHLQFDRNNLAKHKSRADQLTCSTCADAEQKREAEIRKKLRAKGAWKCNCNHTFHTEKCQLHSSRFGDRRWEGRNMGVTEEDLQLLAKRRRK